MPTVASNSGGRMPRSIPVRVSRSSLRLPSSSSVASLTFPETSEQDELESSSWGSSFLKAPIVPSSSNLSCPKGRFPSQSISCAGHQSLEAGSLPKQAMNKWWGGGGTGRCSSSDLPWASSAPDMETSRERQKKMNGALPIFIPCEKRLVVLPNDDIMEWRRAFAQEFKWRPPGEQEAAPGNRGGLPLGMNEGLRANHTPLGCCYQMIASMGLIFLFFPSFFVPLKT